MGIFIRILMEYTIGITVIFHWNNGNIPIRILRIVQIFPIMLQTNIYYILMFLFNNCYKLIN